MKTDIIIIGSGPGGYRTASYAAQQGKQVVIIEGGELVAHASIRAAYPPSVLPTMPKPTLPTLLQP